MDWNTFISIEVTMSHGWRNMIDESQNEFYHPNQADRMHADDNDWEMKQMKCMQMIMVWEIKMRILTMVWTLTPPPPHLANIIT